MHREPLSPSARWALTSLALSMLMPSLDTSIANAGLPTLAAAFDATFQQVQWIVLAYLLAITTLIVSVGRLGDGFGRRRLLLIGIGIFTAASLACALAPSLAWLIGARAVQGLGAAIMFALTVALVADAVPKSRAGSAMGLLATMSATGTTLGPSLGGLLMAHVGWQSIFVINVPLGLLNAWLVYRYLPKDRTARSPVAFDYFGTAVLMLTLAAYALAMTIEGFTQTLLLISLLGVGLFILVEKKSKAPLIHLSLFTDTRISSSLALTLLVTTVMMTTLVVGPFYLSRGLGLSSTQVGLVLSVGPLLAAFSGVPAGRLVDRFGARRMVPGALLGLACGCGLLALLPVSLGLLAYVLPITVVALSYALFQAANNTGLMAGVGQDQRGVVSAMLGLSRNLGLITGAAVMGAVFALATDDPTRATAAVIASGLHMTFGVATALMVAALALGALTHLRLASPGLEKTAQSR
ncbi:MFS transporter [Pseudomonas sp. FW215-R2]|uniref:MFS transporter n=1 Tax=unclassified Pseudomonas TaxID=196821 RepID=UPI000C888D4E|nr:MULTISPECIES: MFS transporter [unclassified Pseudomonas]PMX00680.1 MFS transporter [Pseudomonas sp. FW215-R2]PMX06579.1 MFS transporter [Pseudomonas sp. FW215-L1]PMX22577.1 MFS transporter [Pseudomonas sp. FW215-E1]PNA30430.1 MFS transporter [Pseudomonas sp. FW215-R4]